MFEQGFLFVAFYDTCCCQYLDFATHVIISSDFFYGSQDCSLVYEKLAKKTWKSVSGLYLQNQKKNSKGPIESV